MLKSQKTRSLNPEADPLLLGSGWTKDDLKKPQILLESSHGDSHPGSRHLEELVTDGRFSGASRGPCVGHVSPEAAQGGPIALIEEKDLIHINIKNRSLNMIGVNGQGMSTEEINNILTRRLNRLPIFKNMSTGVLGLFAKMAGNTWEGASML